MEKGAQVMIRLTRLNNRPLVVNSEIIKFIENAPDTVITLITGEKIVVLETPEEVMSRIVEYRRRVLSPVTVAPPSEDLVEQLDEPEDPEKPEEPPENEG
ncbi:MAG: flagellar FlbD family protein [Terriglobia bacterium]